MALGLDGFGEAMIDFKSTRGPLIRYVDQFGCDFRTRYETPLILTARVSLIGDIGVVADPGERVV